MSPALSKESVAILIKDFTEQEIDGMSWFDRLVRNYPVVHETQWYAPHMERLAFGPEQELKPSWLYRLFMSVGIAFLSLVCVALWMAIVRDRFPLLLYMGFLLLLGWLIFIIVRRTFIDKKYNYLIHIDKEGIAIGDVSFLWKDIAATCILSRRQGKRTNAYLVVLTNDRLIQKYDLSGFGTPEWKLSAAIEYYKGQYHLSS